MTSGPDLEAVQTVLGYRFKEPDTLRLALTHSSAGGLGPKKNNERLEFLGDAVLGFAVSDLLYMRLNDSDEDVLTRARSHLVRDVALARLMDEAEPAHRIAGEMVLGKSLLAGGRNNPSIRANVLEALVGGVFLDGGFEPARALALRWMAAAVERLDLERLKDPLSQLNEVLQKSGRKVDFNERPRSGPYHEPTFEVELSIHGVVLGRGRGKKLREAKQAAALEALDSGRL